MFDIWLRQKNIAEQLHHGQARSDTTNNAELNMWDAIQLILLLTIYVAATYFTIKLISQLIVGIYPCLRLLTLSFFYALFWGIGIAGNGGDPGFAFPAPNIVALGLMVSIGFYRGVLSPGLYILGFWWAVIFLVMLAQYFIKRKEGVQIPGKNP